MARPEPKAGDSGEIPGELEWKSMEDIDRADYESLDDKERRAWNSWKNPPKKLTD